MSLDENAAAAVVTKAVLGLWESDLRLSPPAPEAPQNQAPLIAVRGDDGRAALRENRPSPVDAIIEI